MHHGCREDLGEEARSARDYQDAFEFAGHKGKPQDPKTLLGKWCQTLDIPSETPLVVFAAIPKDEYEAKVNTMKLDSAEAVIAVQLNMLQKAQVAIVGRAARLKAGVDEAVATPASAAAPPGQEAAPAPTNDALARRAKLNVILSLVLETEVAEGPSKSMPHYGRYVAVFGEGDRPAPIRTPSMRQLAGIEYLKSTGIAPYLDYAIGALYHHRVMKAMKAGGVVLAADGTLQTRERAGPPNIEEWT